MAKSSWARQGKAKSKIKKKPHRSKPKEPTLLYTYQISGANKPPRVVSVDDPNVSYLLMRGHSYGAMHGDTVACSLHPQPGEHLPRARVRKIIERAVEVLVGRYESDGSISVVIPLDQRIQHDFFLDPLDKSKRRLGLEDGDIVRARILSYPSRGCFGLCTVEERLEHCDAAELALTQLYTQYNVRHSFPDEVLKAAQSISQDLQDEIASELACNPLRKDLRSQMVVTIDPLDAKDFDDALYCEKIFAPANLEVSTAAGSISDKPAQKLKGYRLWVHIADVSHYVNLDGLIDCEAQRRSTSIYLPDRVIPMLPEELSNELCSLKPHEDRLAFSVRMELDAQAHILSFEVYPSVVRSRARLSYDQLDTYLSTGTEEHLIQDDELKDLVDTLFELSFKRIERSREQHSLQFSSEELKLLCDKEGKVYELQLKKPSAATRLVEMCMLLANECVARYLTERDCLAAYRVHEAPEPSALEAMLPLMYELSYDDPELIEGVLTAQPAALQRLLELSQGSEHELLVSYTLLRCMKQAHYTPDNGGHFGLGLDYYCHFTSPIRRYPDLIVHRALKAQLGDSRKQEEMGRLLPRLSYLCNLSSEEERKAELVSRAALKIKLAEFMDQFKGEQFEGHIYMVEPYGLHVELDNKVRGLVHINTLKPYLEPEEELLYDYSTAELYSSDQTMIFRAGDRMSLILKDTDLQRGYIDFEPSFS